MAYIPQDDDEQQAQGGMDVLAGGSPTAVDQQAPAESEPQVVSGSGATIGAGAAPQQAQAPQKKVGKPRGSGMFTDVRKYRQANIPQAARMGQAITQKQQREASKVGQALEQKKQQYQQRVGEQQAKLGQARQFALQQLSQAGQQGVAAPQEDVKRFRDIMTGQTRYTDVGDLSVGQQAARAQQLQRLGRESERAAGARKLLEQTFGGRQYTRGQKTLDELILGADPAARQQMVQSTRGAAQDVSQQIRDARMQAIQQARGLSEGQEELRTGLQEQLGTAREQVQTEVEQQLTDKQEAMRQQQEAMQQAFATGQITADQLAQFTSPEALEKAATDMERTKRLLQFQLGGSEYQRLTQDPKRQAEFNKMMQEMGRGKHYATLDDLRGEMQMADYGQGLAARTGESALDWLTRTREAQEKRQFGDLTSELTESFGPAAVARKLMESGLASAKDIDTALAGARETAAQERAGIQQELDALMKHSDFRHRDDMQRRAEDLRKNLYQTDVRQQADAIGNLIQGMKRVDPRFLTQAIQQDMAARGASPSLYKEFIKAADPSKIGLSDVVTEEQLARQRALASLAGQEGTGIAGRTERGFAPGTLDVAGLFRRLRGI